MSKIDLHIHTTASDGEKTPKEIVDLAIKNNVKFFAITDHDTIDGIKEAVEYSKDKDVEVISGIEIGCKEFEHQPFDIHIVGLFVDLNNKELIEFVKKMKESRVKQKIKMIEILNKLGYKITFEEFKKEAPGGIYGNPHLANILFRKYPEKFKTYQQIFEELLGGGKKVSVQREGKKYKISEVVELIHRAGGIAILAHPGFLVNKAEEIIDIFVKAEGDGIEVDCDYRNIKNVSEKDLIEKFRKIANEKNLLISGGTDFHTEGHSPMIGEHGITEEEFEKLKNFSRH